MQCFIIIAVCFILVSSQAYADNGGKVSVPMRISVSILDFKTTKKVCGSLQPPDWCPAHLLRDEKMDKTGENKFAPDFIPESLGIAESEYEKRHRISKIKERLSAESQKSFDEIILE